MTREEAASCINTIVILKNLCYRVRGLMDVIDAQNCDKIIEMLNTVGETHKKHTETNACDTIRRQAAIELAMQYCPDDDGTCSKADEDIRNLLDELENMPSAQPERTCVNCGRTANNGGWYADGGTRCPIEEHYALPKDGYCHLWEKRNVTDDDYPERQKNEQV